MLPELESIAGQVVLMVECRGELLPGITRAMIGGTDVAGTTPFGQKVFITVGGTGPGRTNSVALLTGLTLAAGYETPNDVPDRARDCCGTLEGEIRPSGFLDDMRTRMEEESHIGKRVSCGEDSQRRSGGVEFLKDDRMMTVRTGGGEVRSAVVATCKGGGRWAPGARDGRRGVNGACKIAELNPAKDACGIVSVNKWKRFRWHKEGKQIHTIPSLCHILEGDYAIPMIRRDSQVLPVWWQHSDLVPKAIGLKDRLIIVAEGWSSISWTNWWRVREAAEGRTLFEGILCWQYKNSVEQDTKEGEQDTLPKNTNYLSMFHLNLCKTHRDIRESVAGIKICLKCCNLLNYSQAASPFKLLVSLDLNLEGHQPHLYLTCRFGVASLNVGWRWDGASERTSQMELTDRLVVLDASSKARQMFLKQHGKRCASLLVTGIGGGSDTCIIAGFGSSTGQIKLFDREDVASNSDGTLVLTSTGNNPCGDTKDIDEAIMLHREALEIHSAPHPDQGMSLNNLAAAAQTQFEQHGDPKGIDEAIMLHREALEIHAAHHPNCGMSLNNLAAADIDEAIMLHTEALELRAAPHPDRRMSLNNVAAAIRTRFEQRVQTLFEQHGDPKDIDEAIMLHREALELRAAPHPNQGGSLNNLANAVQTRFEQHCDPNDIDEAIMLYREALELHAAPHPNRGGSLNNLASAVRTRFEQHGDTKDIDEAIMLHKEAVEIYAAPHPNRRGSLNNLASAVRTRFEQHGDPKDIDEAIMLHREAPEICAAPHPDRGMSLNNLVNAVQTRFEQHGDPKDIDEAIMLHREALELRAAPHPNQGSSLDNLASAVQTWFMQHSDPKDINEAMTLHRHAATYIYSSALTRFTASHKWIRNATRHSHGSSLDDYHSTISLLPQLAPFSLDLKSRQQMLAREDIVSLASTAATYYAIGLNQNKMAVELLEASRCKTELAGSQLNEAWDKTVSAVRKVPGFEDFLQPKSLASLQQAAVSGPIVILLASDSACLALIVKSSEDVQHVKLPTLNLQTVQRHYADLPCALSDRTFNTVQRHYADLPCALSDRTFNVKYFLENHGCGDALYHQSDLEARLFGAQEDRVNMSPNDIFRRVFADIWQTIVKPVFEVLKLKKSDNPSRLWWCPTGPFAFVPIHAAGIYNPEGTDCVSDYVISSNTPTLTALLDPPAHIPAFFKMTVMIEPHASKCDPLPGTALELEKIKNRVPSQWLTALESTTRNTVMQHLHNSSVIHFACHGTQDFENPLNSGLVLSDGRLDIAQIMRIPVNDRTHMMKNSMKLAFLSACETAKGDEKALDEAMHLAASLLFAGFGGVIAIMCRMNDDDGPKIADTFYEYLFKDCSPDSASPRVPDLRKAAKALHLAVKALYKEPGMTFDRWIPFISPDKKMTPASTMTISELPMSDTMYFLGPFI
ncbi:CHAT domain-containing protein [Mycena rebaudengoi]|nr:CHAT domain-containing protein [Mycena rebaudengoi]